jgi:hypothetical protein
VRCPAGQCHDQRHQQPGLVAPRWVRGAARGGSFQPEPCRWRHGGLGVGEGGEAGSIFWLIWICYGVLYYYWVWFIIDVDCNWCFLMFFLNICWLLMLWLCHGDIWLALVLPIGSGLVRLERGWQGWCHDGPLWWPPHCRASFEHTSSSFFLNTAPQFKNSFFFTHSTIDRSWYIQLFKPRFKLFSNFARHVASFSVPWFFPHLGGPGSLTPRDKKSRFLLA